MNRRVRASTPRRMTPTDRAALVTALNHDLRQPKHVMEMGFRTMRLLISDARDAVQDTSSLLLLLDQMAKEVATLRAAARQLTDAQQDLIDAVRMEAGETLPQTRTVDADQLIERVRKSVRGLVPLVSVRAVKSRLAFVSDEGWVERVLNNLVGNAIWHSDCTEVSVRARRCGDKICFEVKDDGAGIASAKLAGLSQPLSARSLQSLLLSAPRSGLGLYIVRVLAERLGGSIKCESQPGGGTVFRLNLPGPVSSIDRSFCRLNDETAECKLVVVLAHDTSLVSAVRSALSEVTVEVYADTDPLRWLNTVTSMRRPPELMLIELQSESALHIDILRRRWKGHLANVFGIAELPVSPTLTAIARELRILHKPLTAAEIRLIQDVLGSVTRT